MSPEAAEKALDHLPLCLEKDLTRGQAEELLELLQREKVNASMRFTKLA